VARDQWLTPDTPPAGFTCGRLLIPDNPEWIATVAGALLPLIYASNFEQFGTATPADCAAIFQSMFDQFAKGGGVCMGSGAIFAVPSTTPPSGTLICDGATYNRSDYPSLYDVLDPIYQVSGTTFVTPDLRGNVLVGAGGAYAVGDSGGANSIALTVAEIAAHSHSDTGHSHAEGVALPNVTTVGPGAPQPTAIPGVGATGIGFATIANSGGGVAHENRQPYLALLWVIAT
jgi:microcystin-dependent protein